ncbi:cystatin-like 1 isoform X1 [Ictidomys tridecemlineatus]
MGLRAWRTPLLLLVGVVLVAVLGHFERWEGFQNVSMSKNNRNSTLSFFIDSYNNASNDTYLFRVRKLIRSQMQLTTGVEYLLTVKISRTKCKRNETKTTDCPLQKKKLKKFSAYTTSSFVCGAEDQTMAARMPGERATA